MNLTRNTFLGLCLSAVCYGVCLPSQADQAPSIGPIEVQEENAPLPPLSEAYPKLRNAITETGTPDNSGPALQTLRRYDGVEAWIAAEIAEDVSAKRYDLRCYYNFEVLARLRTVKSLRVIGIYIHNKTLLDSGVEDVGGARVDGLAAMALAKMKLIDAPTNERGGLTEEDIELWGGWWEENKGNLEEALNPMPKAAPAPDSSQSRRFTSDELAPTTADKVHAPLDRSSLPGLLLVALGIVIAITSALLLRRRKLE